jgi:hypothetical protein
MDDILYKLLEQTPVIIALGVGIYALWKEKKETKKETLLERKYHSKVIKEMTDKHAAELKILNEYIRARDLETLEALETVTAAVESINQLINNKLL